MANIGTIVIQKLRNIEFYNLLTVLFWKVLKESRKKLQIFKSLDEGLWHAKN